ncbi:LysR family transcriptional regulator [Thalassotalea ganghwensis]
MLNPVWLKTFVTLVDTGHFTKAAEKLFMTQPGVSQHIAKLEQASNHILIKRDKKSFAITEQGRLVYHYAKKLVENERYLIESLSFDDPCSGACSLACSGSVALLLYPKLLDLQHQHPKLIVKLKAAPNQQVLTEVKEGVIDQGIVTDVANKTLFDVTELGKEELCLVVPSDTDVSGINKTVLVNLGLVSHPDAEHYLSLYFAQSEDSFLARINMTDIPQVGFINQINQILEPIAKGIGFTIIPKSAVDSFAKRNSVKIIKPSKPVIETLYLVRKKHRILPARFETFNSVIKQAWQ